MKAGRPRLFADDPIVVRLTTETVEHLDAHRYPGEARSAAARRILADALKRRSRVRS